MNSMMQPMSNAAAAQQHQFTVERDGTTLACDGTASVAQGDNLVVKVTGTLQSAVAASGWTAGVGPNYIVEVTQATALVRAMSPVGESRYAACPDSAGSNNRITSPGVDVLVTPVAAGELKIRLASAYGYGTVYLADECTLTATGTASVSTVSGFLVCKTMDNQLVTPFEHSLADLRACQSTGFAIIQETSEGSGTWAVATELDAAGNDVARTHLQQLVDDNAGTANYAAGKKDMQYTVTGFTSGSTISVIDLGPCVKGVCAGYYDSAAPPPADAICYDGGGYCITSSTVENGVLTTVVTSDDESWFGLGVSTPSGGMVGDGGSDIFICSEEGLNRYWVTKRENPAGQPTVTWDGADQGECTFADGKGTMTIKRTLAAGANEREILLGSPDTILWARGPRRRKALVGSSAHRAEGFASLDLTNLAGGSSKLKLKGPWTLWLHLIFMAFAWGVFLPMGAAIAKFCRPDKVPGAPPGAWFGLHKAFQRIGWTFQVLGLIFAVCHCDKYSVHFEEPHTIIGLVVVIIGTLQPFQALLRPHPPPGGWPNGQKPAGRKLFEGWHKGFGWAAILLGMANVIIGAVLAKEKEYNTATYAVPLAIGSTGIAAFALYALLGLTSPNNAINRTLTGAKPGGEYETVQKMRPP